MPIKLTYLYSGYEEDYTIAAFIWSSEINNQHAYFVALFDINQWYQAQMPNAVRWRRSSGKYNGLVITRVVSTLYQTY